MYWYLYVRDAPGEPGDADELTADGRSTGRFGPALPAARRS
jgi:hypothetical protein